MIRLIACGKVREKWMKDGIEEYASRIRPYDRLELIEVQDEKAPESYSDAQNEQVKKTEGERILKQIREDDYVILLDLAGRTWSSTQMADFMQDLYNRSKNRITFVIGGTLGVSDDLIRRADRRWKISDSTFPHQLCRIIVLEQIYRSFRILHNEPYHK
ncbi:MAG: 23S rRNA (pseudouridine(1915)-N(3))-methyltransferase RlmH [Solobacterium sp.]|nr:23S rRNA (pseudouridine(1915)-N(3))-methyltransferase RlmH [Solobacterium sp.]